MRLLIDEDTQARRLVEGLRDAGHDVRTVAEEALSAQSDDLVLARACQLRRVVVTRNCDDFAALHALDAVHFGILLIYQDRDPSKRMTYGEIIAAIGNIASSGVVLNGELVVLNQYTW